jgi:dihydroneopterin aldolase/2-amino-4-hydroxy-6-hydroxymethyldihydropteridine diphosphokinase
MTFPATDKVEIRGLIVTTVVGVLPHERTTAQPIRIDLDLHVDLRDAGRTDDLLDTADYGDVAQRVADIVRESKDTLLERLADRVAEMLVAINRVEAVDVTVTKLRPPIPEQLDSTAVRIHRSRRDYNVIPREQHLAIIALGSSLGDREAYLRLAVNSFEDVLGMSQVFETDPVGGPDDQGAYLNMVIAVQTALDPYALLRRCLQIEASAYRQRVVHWGPRTLDLDLLFYDDVCIDDPQLTIPHPRLTERRFVLAPLQEVSPERCPTDWDTTLPSGGVYPRGPLQLTETVT